MIPKKTVFVLGAGASKPFGFPTGFELREQICSLLDVRSPAANLLIESGYLPDSKFSSFVKNFLHSGLNSIDSFLSRNIQLADVGAATIAASLLTKEISSSLYGVGGKIANSDWYGLLWNCLVDQLVDASQIPEKNNITFITFNYDRSLEKFLLQSTMSTFNLDVAAASEVCKNFHIHHMYGSLGDFDWKNNLNFGLPKDPLDRRQVLHKAAAGIKVMPAQRHKNADHVARQELADAENVVFLGFGFDATNCERLGMPDVFIDSYGKNKFRQIFITTSGMTISEVERARKLMLGSEDHQRDSVVIYNGYCYDALRNWGILPG